MRIRTATTDDARAVEQLRLRTWQVAYAGLVPESFLRARQVTDESLARWVTRLGDRTVSTWVAEHDSTVDTVGTVGTVGTVDAVGTVGIIGMAVAGACRDPDLLGSRELYALYVDAGSWGGRSGSALLAAAGAVEVLWVLEGNARARAFYERHGFAADGERKVLDLGGPVVEVRYRR